jgi:hypothetical protein
MRVKLLCCLQRAFRFLCGKLNPERSSQLRLSYKRKPKGGVAGFVITSGAPETTSPPTASTLMGVLSMFPGFLIEILITLIIVGLVFWIIQQIPIPEPFGRIIRVVLVVVFAIWLIYVLAGLLPVGAYLYPHR